jgi:hypothetical protein
VKKAPGNKNRTNTRIERFNDVLSVDVKTSDVQSRVSIRQLLKRRIANDGLRLGRGEILTCKKEF